MYPRHGIDGSRSLQGAPKQMTRGTITDERNYFLIGWVAPAMLWIILLIALAAFVRNRNEAKAVVIGMFVLGIAIVGVWVYFSWRFARFLGYRPSTTVLFCLGAGLSGVLGVFVGRLWAFAGAIVVFGWLTIHSVVAKQELADFEFGQQASGAPSPGTPGTPNPATIPIGGSGSKSDSAHMYPPPAPGTGDGAGALGSAVQQPAPANPSSVQVPAAPDRSAAAPVAMPNTAAGQSGSPPRYCIICGTANPSAAIFCASCGNVIPDVESAPPGPG